MRSTVASFVKVKNINPLGAVEIAIEGWKRTVGAGEVIAVPPEVAGHPAAWRAPQPGDDLTFLECVRNEDNDVISVYDLGAGLLAQPENWELVAEKTAKTETTTEKAGN